MKATPRPAGALWRRCLRLTALLLAMWAGITFGTIWFARSLTFDFFGWPFSFWMAAQGALLLYVILIVLYARQMNRWEREDREDHEQGVAGH